MTSTPQALTHLQDISGAFYAGKIDRDEARSRVIDVVLARLACSRVSLWRFDGDADDLSLLCFAAKRAGGELITTETLLHGSEYRDYFGGLVKNGMYVADDAMADPTLQPMRKSYLLPNRVLSMLDAAVMVNGRAYGMVCCEQTNAIRPWRVDEVAALRAITAKLALLMAGAADAALRASPSLPMAPIYVFA
jgi:GAF domain-containing protein